MSHLRFCRATLTRDKVEVCDFIVARCDFDAACDKQTWLPAIWMTLRQSRSVRLWSRTLRLCRASQSRVKVARQNRRCDMALRQAQLSGATFSWAPEEFCYHQFLPAKKNQKQS